MPRRKKPDPAQPGLLEARVATAPGEYRVVVKVIDLLGNDTTKTVRVRVK
jgi:hypothetical protein